MPDPIADFFKERAQRTGGFEGAYYALRREVLLMRKRLNEIAALPYDDKPAGNGGYLDLSESDARGYLQAAIAEAEKALNESWIDDMAAGGNGR